MLPPRIGRTADEFAAEAGRALPVHADALRDAARQFDEIRYGQRPGSRAGYERLSELDRRIMAGAPRASRPGGAAPPRSWPAARRHDRLGESRPGGPGQPRGRASAPAGAGGGRPRRRWPSSWSAAW